MSLYFSYSIAVEEKVNKKDKDEMALWKQLDPTFMSDEEADEDDNGMSFFIRRSPVWRSLAVTNLIRRVDERLKKRPGIVAKTRK